MAAVRKSDASNKPQVSREGRDANASSKTTDVQLKQTEGQHRNKGSEPEQELHNSPSAPPLTSTSLSQEKLQVRPPSWKLPSPEFPTTPYKDHWLTRDVKMDF